MATASKSSLVFLSSYDSKGNNNIPLSKIKDIYPNYYGMVLYNNWKGVRDFGWDSLSLYSNVETSKCYDVEFEDSAAVTYKVTIPVDQPIFCVNRNMGVLVSNINPKEHLFVTSDDKICKFVRATLRDTISTEEFISISTARAKPLFFNNILLA